MKLYDELRELQGLEDKTDKELKAILMNEYKELISLRNRIRLGYDTYDEDKILIDHILDYMEIMIDKGE